MPELRKSKLDLYVSEQVKRKRLAVGMSQAILAVKLNVSDAFIGQAEQPNHKTKYNLSHLNKIAQIFKCKIQDFLPEEPFEE